MKVNKTNLRVEEPTKWMTMGTAEVLAEFGGVPGAVARGEGDQAFVYVPGARRNCVLLDAHADTVWDKYGIPCKLEYADGVFRSGAERRGIGADDRAGCDMLWCLRDLGHSLLVTSGEENGQQASRAIMEDEAHRDIAEEIQQTHQFAVEFDRRHARDFKCYDVGTDEFRAYCAQMTGYTEPDREPVTDICVLCRDICGVNLSVGFYGEHTPDETLNVAEWQGTLLMARTWLADEQLPRFVRNNSGMTYL